MTKQAVYFTSWYFSIHCLIIAEFNIITRRIRRTSRYGDKFKFNKKRFLFFEKYRSQLLTAVYPPL